MRRNRDYLIDLTRMRLASPDELNDMLKKESWPVYDAHMHKRIGKMSITDFLEKFG